MGRIGSYFSLSDQYIASVVENYIYQVSIRVDFTCGYSWGYVPNLLILARVGISFGHDWSQGNKKNNI